MSDILEGDIYFGTPKEIFERIRDRRSYLEKTLEKLGEIKLNLNICPCCGAILDG